MISASFHEITKIDDADADDREDVLEEEDQPVAEEEADALQVDGRAAHQLAGLVPVVEAEREPDELRVERRPHVHLDEQRLLAGDQPAARHHQRARDAERRRRAPMKQRQMAELVVAERPDDAAGRARSRASAAACEPTASTIET